MAEYTIDKATELYEDAISLAEDVSVAHGLNDVVWAGTCTTLAEAAHGLLEVDRKRIAALEKCIGNACKNLCLFRCAKCGDLAERITSRPDTCPTCDVKEGG